MGTSPARFAVERHRWDEAAVLTVPGNIFPGGRWAWTEANLHFARALGASHTNQIDVAQQEVRKLGLLRDTLTEIGDVYWADQLAIQSEIATAWISFAQGKREQALQQMRSAADHEDKTDKNNVTPGVLLPARELLGDMLVELNQPAAAVPEYEAVLRTAPNRYNALAGAAGAARLSGDAAKAKAYYGKLLSICAHADGDRPELRDARTMLAGK
jgi:tetratricopeptide (TPR) repeat protein